MSAPLWPYSSALHPSEFWLSHIFCSSAESLEIALFIKLRKKFRPYLLGPCLCGHTSLLLEKIYCINKFTILQQMKIFCIYYFLSIIRCSVGIFSFSLHYDWYPLPLQYIQYFVTERKFPIFLNVNLLSEWIDGGESVWRLII